MSEQYEISQTVRADNVPQDEPQLSPSEEKKIEEFTKTSAVEESPVKEIAEEWSKVYEVISNAASSITEKGSKLVEKVPMVHHKLMIKVEHESYDTLHHIKEKYHLDEKLQNISNEVNHLWQEGKQKAQHVIHFIMFIL